MSRIRQQKSPEARRKDILQAAEKLFISQGVSATRIEDITAEANIGKGTLYLYFRNKEDLLIGLGDVFLKYFLERTDYHKKKTLDKTLNTQINAWLKGCLDAFYDKAQLHDLLFHNNQPKPINHYHANPAVQVLEDVLSLHTKELEKAQFQSILMFNLVHGAVEYALTQTPIIDKTTLFYRLSPILQGLPTLTSNASVKS